jgi:trimeric autotransporter adhesin
MKKYLNAQALIIIVISQCFYFTTNAQNTFPSSGNVGIGTSSPTALLQVTGGDANLNGVRTGMGNGGDIGNTCFGREALLNNDLYNGISSYNTAIGYQSLLSNTSGELNTGVGAYSLKLATSAYRNTALGAFAMWLHKTGDFNTAVGALALRFDSIGQENTAIGASCLPNNRGNQNTGLGTYSLLKNEGGSNNTATGFQSLYYNISGHYNTSVGANSLYNNTYGFGNACLGNNSLTNNTSGSYNTAIGFYSTTNSSALSNTTALGYNARTTASNQVRIGNNNVTSIGGYAGWTNVSDGRIKRNIQENVPGLTFINRLKPVTYNLDLDEADKIIGSVKKEELKMGAEAEPTVNDGRLKKQQVVYTGFIAQEVEEAAKKINYQFSGIDAPENEHSLYGLRYADFVVPLVKSIQELSRMNAEKDAEISSLRKEMQELKKLVLGAKQNNNQPAALLEQNVPNPFTNTTVIPFKLPGNYVKAKIIITDKNGKICRETDVSGVGQKNISVNTSAFSAGTYQYSLFVSEQLIDTKQMLIIK